jgi:superfamily II DNA or RNA helicase
VSLSSAGAIAPAACVPVLKLFMDEVTVHTVDGLASSYETRRLPLLAISFEHSGGPPDLAAEARARRLLESLGALDLSCLDDVATSADADYVLRCEENVHEFCAFTAHCVPQLRALGWRVEIAEDYEYRTLEREPTWHASLEPSEDREDWFGLHLGVEIEGEHVDLLPALLELLDSSGKVQGLRDVARRATKCVALRVGERLYLTIPPERMRAVLRVLAELYDDQRDGVFLAKQRGHVLAGLDELFAAGHARIEWSGAGATIVQQGRALARATAAPAEMPVALKATLRPYQIEGLAWMQQLLAQGAGGILADDMGLGKTLQTIAFFAVEKERRRLERPALIVAPTSLVHNWLRELGKFAPHLRVVAIHGAKRAEAWQKLDKADVVVSSYPILCRDEERFEQHVFSTVVLDEAQTIKNQRSRVHRAVRCIQSERRLLLTGTPVENHLGELWALVDFLNPGLLGDELHFGRHYRIPIERFGDQDRLESLRNVLAPYVLRRTKAQVATELPPKTELSRPIEIRGKQRELYESIRLAAHAEVRKVIKKRGLAGSTIPILGALTRLRQVCCDPRLSDLGGAIGESAKYELLMEMVERQLGQGHRILIFSQFTSMLALIGQGLTERRIRFSILTGATENRQAACDAFERGETDVFLISLKAGGTGLTLTSADTVIHYDPWWNPAVQAQASDRAYRIGQTKPVFVHNLFIAGSVEERMLRLQRRKRHVADAILGNAPQGPMLTEDEIDQLFAPLSA